MNDKVTPGIRYDEVNPTLNGSDDPFELAQAFKALLGSVHSEFDNNINQKVIEQSSTLRRVDGKSILEKGVKEIMKVNPSRPDVTDDNPFRNVPIPVQTHSNIAADVPKQDSHQLELNFDKSATALQIFESLERLHRKFDDILDRLDKPIVKSKKSKL